MGLYERLKSAVSRGNLFDYIGDIKWRGWSRLAPVNRRGLLWAAVEFPRARYSGLLTNFDQSASTDNDIGVVFKWADVHSTLSVLVQKNTFYDPLWWFVHLKSQSVKVFSAYLTKNITTFTFVKYCLKLVDE